MSYQQNQQVLKKKKEAKKKKTVEIWKTLSSLPHSHSYNNNNNRFVYLLKSQPYSGMDKSITNN